MIRVAGVAVGRFQLIDGRSPDSAAEVAEMLAAFQPGIVPIVSRHGPDGLLLGYVTGLTAEHGRDLRFTGSVVADPDLTARLRGGCSVSIETAEGRELYPGESTGSGVALSQSNPHWRGQVQLGQNLIGVAVSERPAARDSVMWADSESES